MNNEAENLQLIEEHVEILTLAQLARQQLEDANGVRAAIIKLVGSFLQGELERSQGRMKARRIWIKDDPERDGLNLRFAYSVAGRRGVYEVERAKLRAHMTERVEDYSALVERVKIEHVPLIERYRRDPIKL